MKSKSFPIALIATAALGFPAGASAADIQTAVDAAERHTQKAEAALDRATTLFAKGRESRGSRALSVSRRATAAAVADARRATRAADGRSDRRLAAAAQRLVAEHQDENIEQLVTLLDEADGGAETRAAAAVLADTRGRERAIAVLSRLAERGVSNRSAKGIARALVALSQDRDQEIEVEVEALTSEDVSASSAEILGDAVEANVEGQVTSASKLAELIASDSIPAAAAEGLQRAYDAVTGEQERSAAALEDACPLMPESVCTRVSEVAAGARSSAQEMRETRGPAADGGDPRPDGAPASAPTGAPTRG